MKNSILAIFLASILFSNCELLEEGGISDVELSDAEIVEGLKTALAVGADSASNILSIADGYYGDALVKIPLPEEAEAIRGFVSNNIVAEFFDLDQQFENVILSVNRAAENAAEEAAPIFKDAITSLSISDGWDILHGIVPEGSESLGVEYKTADFDSIAATKFLKGQTFEKLTKLYGPKINTALDKDLGLGFTAVGAWSTLTSTYNETLNRREVQLALSAAALLGNNVDVPGEFNTDLGEFSTQKALDGLFLKVGEEERKIRRNPWAWALDILEKVFGSLFD